MIKADIGNFEAIRKYREKIFFLKPRDLVLDNDVYVQKNKDIISLKQLQSYRGIRHTKNLKVRGQKTKSCGRKNKQNRIHSQIKSIFIF